MRDSHMDELYMYVQVNTTVNSALRSGHLHVFISTCICRLPSLVNIYLVVRRVESDNRHIVLHHTLYVLQICVTFYIIIMSKIFQ